MTCLLAWVQQSPVILSWERAVEPTPGLWALCWNVSANFSWQYHVDFFTFLILSHLHVTIWLNFFFRIWPCHDFIYVGAFVLLHHSKCWIKLPFLTLREVCLPGLCALGLHTFQSNVSLVWSRTFPESFEQSHYCNSNFHSLLWVFNTPAITYE